MSTSPITPPLRLLRLPAVSEATGLQRTAIYDLLAAGKFPKPITLTKTKGGKSRCVAWASNEVERWIAERIAERDAPPKATKPRSGETAQRCDSTRQLQSAAS